MRFFERWRLLRAYNTFASAHTLADAHHVLEEHPKLISEEAATLLRQSANAMGRPEM
jgi:hypothetical protein